MRTSNLIKCGKSVKQKNCIQRLMLEVFFFFITYMIDCICRYQITEPLDYVTGGCFSKQIKSKQPFATTSDVLQQRPLPYTKAVIYTLKLGTRAL